MNVTLNYFAQIRQKAGTEAETVGLSDGSTVFDALMAVDHGEPFRSVLFDGSGALRPVILLVLNGVPSASDAVLHDGDQLQLFSPVSGG